MSTADETATSEKEGSPIKLEHLPRLSENVYDVSGESLTKIHEFLESSDGKLCEWFDGQFVQKIEAGSESEGAEWIIADYFVGMRGSGWVFSRNVHVAGEECAFIPDGVGTLRHGVGTNNRQCTPYQGSHGMCPQPLPHFVLEVEWEHNVYDADKGFSKVINRLFPMVGPDGSRIEEGWLLSLPQSSMHDVTLPVVRIPLAEQPILQLQPQPPPAGTVYLAILQRPAHPAKEVIRGYYHIVPNARFEVPPFSILSASGPGGPPGAPVLSTNWLLRGCSHIQLVDQPTGQQEGSPIKLEHLPRLSENVYDVSGESLSSIREFLDSSEGDMFEWFDGKLVQKVEAGSEAAAAEWILSSYYTGMDDSGWLFYRNAHVSGKDRAFIPDGIAILRYGTGTNNRPCTPYQAAHAMSPQPLPQFVLEVEWEHSVYDADKGIPKVINRLFPMVGPDGSRMEEGWLLSLPQSSMHDVTLPVVGIPLAEQPILQLQPQPPPAGTIYLAILRRPAHPAMQAIRGYYHIVPNARFKVPPFSILSAAGHSGPPGAPVLSTNRLLSTCMYIQLVDEPA
jgi:succinate dehydrogenase flavin-adding protein (antitoxin of CptAB toxin-antitoxin module)